MKWADHFGLYFYLPFMVSIFLIFVNTLLFTVPNAFVYINLAHFFIIKSKFFYIILI